MGKLRSLALAGPETKNLNRHSGLHPFGQCHCHWSAAASVARHCRSEKVKGRVALTSPRIPGPTLVGIPTLAPFQVPIVMEVRCE
eukprot:1851643-Rhodomonas_salina.1